MNGRGEIQFHRVESSVCSLSVDRVGKKNTALIVKLFSIGDPSLSRNGICHFLLSMPS